MAVATKQSCSDSGYIEKNSLEDEKKLMKKWPSRNKTLKKKFNLYEKDCRVLVRVLKKVNFLFMKLFPDESDIFQDNNAHIHKAKVVTEHHKEHSSGVNIYPDYNSLKT